MRSNSSRIIFCIVVVGGQSCSFAVALAYWPLDLGTLAETVGNEAIWSTSAAVNRSDMEPSSAHMHVGSGHSIADTDRALRGSAFHLSRVPNIAVRQRSGHLTIIVLIIKRVPLKFSRDRAQESQRMGTRRRHLIGRVARINEAIALGKSDVACTNRALSKSQ